MYPFSKTSSVLTGLFCMSKPGQQMNAVAKVNGWNRSQLDSVVCFLLFLFFCRGHELGLCQQCFINPFPSPCLPFPAWTRTEWQELHRLATQKERLLCFWSPCFPPRFPFPAPSRKSKSRLGFNDSRSWSLWQTSIAAGGGGGSPSYCVILSKWTPAPTLSSSERPPTSGVCCR